MSEMAGPDYDLVRVSKGPVDRVPEAVRIVYDSEGRLIAVPTEDFADEALFEEPLAGFDEAPVGANGRKICGWSHAFRRRVTLERGFAVFARGAGERPFCRSIA
jgi:hypothetical protein